MSLKYEPASVPQVFAHDFWGQKMDDWQSHKSFRPLTILSFRLDPKAVN